MKLWKKKAVWWVCGCLAGRFMVAKSYKNYISKLTKISDKHLRLFLLMCRWVEIRQEGKNVAAYLEQRGYSAVAIYGMNYIGERLLNELQGSRIKILYAIDQNMDEIYTKVKVIKMKDELPAVDAIIVTPVSYFTEIRNQLAGKVTCPILSLENVLGEM